MQNILIFLVGIPILISILWKLISFMWNSHINIVKSLIEIFMSVLVFIGIVELSFLAEKAYSGLGIITFIVSFAICISMINIKEKIKFKQRMMIYNLLRSFDITLNDDENLELHRKITLICKENLKGGD